MSAKTLRTTARTVAISLILALFLFPVYWMITMAFKPQPQWAPTTGETYWFPESPTFGNFKRIFGGEPTDESGLGFLTSTPIDATDSIITSLIVAGLGTVLALLVGISTAYGISRFRAGGKLLPFAILQLRMFPPIAVIIPVLFLWTYLQLNDTYWGLILIYGAVTFPFVVWLMRSFFDEIPREIAEAAIVDGCSNFGAFRKTILPLVKGGLATTALFVFILNWSDYLIALVLAGSRVITAPVFLSQIRSASTGVEFGSQAALALILILPPVVLAIAIQKHLVRGLTFGAIKR